MKLMKPFNRSNDKRAEYNNIKYLISSKEKIAEVIGIKVNCDEIIIPTSINHESEEYYVTSILINAFKFSTIKYVQFASHSKIQTIEKDAFCNSTIESIRIPSRLVNLKKGWCNGTPKLTKIIVSRKNPRYFYFEDKMIIGKTRIEQSYYDCLIISVRDIEYIKIPDFIEHICSCSFHFCTELKHVEFSNESKLQTIEESAFSYSKIKKIIIPSSVTTIENNAFSLCKQLELIEFANDSKLQTIGASAFSFSAIKIIKIPSSVKLIKEHTFYFCNQLQQIEIPNDSKLQTIEKDAFCNSTIESIKIPSRLANLKKGWCNVTPKLTKIIVSPKNPRYCSFESKMIIGKTRIEQNNYDCLVFCVRDIQYVKIPDFIEHICSCSFQFCTELKHVEFSNESKLQTIEESAFSYSKIKKIIIPSSVTTIENNTFYLCRKLELIEFANDSKLQTIGASAFSFSAIKNIKIPSSVKLIKEHAFDFCDRLRQIEIPNDSKLQTIEKDAFFNSAIESIKIPSELVNLKKGWCNVTPKLTKITVSPKNPRYCSFESKMIIGKTRIEQNNYDCLVFCVRDIQYVKIPDFIEHICSCSFQFCTELKHVEFPNKSKLQTIEESAFSYSAIKKIIIPSSVTTIENSAFSCCQQLDVVEFENDSKLQIIKESAFSFSKISSIIIPPSVTLIEGGAFNDCKNLLIIETANVKMILMYLNAFYNFQVILLMIPVHSQ